MYSSWYFHKFSANNQNNATYVCLGLNRMNWATGVTASLHQSCQCIRQQWMWSELSLCISYIQYIYICFIAQHSLCLDWVLYNYSTNWQICTPSFNSTHAAKSSLLVYFLFVRARRLSGGLKLRDKIMTGCTFTENWKSFQFNWISIDFFWGWLRKKNPLR